MPYTTEVALSSDVGHAFRGAAGIVAAVERLPELRAIHPAATIAGNLEPPASRAAIVWSRADAIAELLRGRVSVTGPTTAGALAASLDVSIDEADAALLQLESEGLVLRGQFTRGTKDLEWCDRTLLARIHRYTLNRLRAEIEPVSPADFMRFLFRWQHVEPSSRLTGLDGLREIIAKLDGYELGASAWERTVLPSRLDRYESAMLDMICLTGEAGWARLSPAPSSTGAPASLVPATPVALFLQEHAAVWQTLRAPREAPLPLTDDARVVLDTLRARGALFFGALASACGFDADRLRQAIGTLVACGLATSDGFAGLRALVRAARGRFAPNDRRTKFAGRWAAIATPSEEDTRSRVSGIDEAREEAVAAQAWTLLRRYGIVCRRVLTRETNVLPWRELVRVYRRLEARGEVRGGRFVAGLSGEQFALPEAVERMREVRRSAPDDALITISAADPLNLAGIVTAGERIRAIGRSRIVYRNGAPLAVLEGDTVRELAPIDPSIAADVSRALRPRRASAVLV